jgi:hypothetical protein
VIALVLLAAQQSEPTREERVLELLQALHGSLPSTHWDRAIFESGPPSIGSEPVVRAEYYDISCGNGDDGTFDDLRARECAAALFRIFGLAPEREVALRSGPGACVLDGLDHEARIGFELRGIGRYESMMEALPEEDERGLDEHELAALSAAGYRMHVADVADHRVRDRDGFTPMLAYLAGVVRFLNRVTQGEDVELGGITFDREAYWSLPLRGGPDVEITPIQWSGQELSVGKPATLVLRCRGLADYSDAASRDAWGFSEQPLDAENRKLRSSTRGAPSLLLLIGRREPLDGTAGELPAFSLRVRQSRAGPELVHETRSWAALLPAEFDLAEPFDLELDLSPGRYRIYGPARIGAAGE